jgi:RimJ/RimL family protein N-acetyltransferase
MEAGYPKWVSLGEERRVELRPARATDEEAVVRFMTGLPPESTQFLKDNVRDPNVVHRFFQNVDPERVWAILALAGEGKVVGDATLHTAKVGWRRHIGEVRVVVAPAYQKHRLATTLLHELVNHASLKGIKKLEAQILDSQTGAKLAFEHLGFRVEARLAGHALDLEGKPHDLLILTNTVDDLWQKMEDLVSDLEFTPEGY